MSVGGGKTICRIYSQRLGTRISDLSSAKSFCGYRGMASFDYEGCPYNKGLPLVGVDIPLLSVSEAKQADQENKLLGDEI